MTLQTWLAFVAASAVVLVIPGPTILTATSYAMTYGRRVTALLVAAVALGDATGLALSLLGLGTLLAQSSVWFDIVKWVGGVVLVGLGLGLIRRPVSLMPVGAAGPLPPRRLFATMYAVTALNPKGVVFYVGFIPLFVDPDGDVASQLWLLGATFVVLAALNAAIYTAFASFVRQRLASRKAQRGLNVFGGLVLMAAGLWALLAPSPGVR